MLRRARAARARSGRAGLAVTLILSLACLGSPRIRRIVVTLVEIAVLYVTWSRG